MRRFALLVVLACCGTYGENNDTAPSGTDAGAGAEAGADAGSTIDSGTTAEAGSSCKGNHGPTPVDVGTYCVDSTEVTNRQYLEFLAAKAGDTSGQPPECTWNTTLDPAAGIGPDEYPVAFVDWCDALAYCTWAGKRLCGRVGGGPLPDALRGNTFSDEWFRACSHDGERQYPGGNAYDAGACADKSAAPVQTKPGCEGGYPGLFDMGGNVQEWIDSCAEGGAPAQCLARGGSYATAGYVSCDEANGVRRDRGSVNDIGIRCCADKR